MDRRMIEPCERAIELRDCGSQAAQQFGRMLVERC
jgi:hypothetical protein